MHGDIQSEKDRNWQWAKEDKLVATQANFEEPTLECDVEGAWKKMRAAPLKSVGDSFGTTQACTERTLRKHARPPTFNKRQWTRSLLCCPDMRSSTTALFWRNSALESKLGHRWSSDRASKWKPSNIGQNKRRKSVAREPWNLLKRSTKLWMREAQS